jgi:LysR family hydrogen peroxide-inducible transcriptional activator
MRFEDPEPRRVIGLAWRKNSPRKADFIELGEVITASTSELRKQVAVRIG